MKTLAIIAVAGALASPALTLAQGGNEPVTRAQVRGELIQLEQAGYDPAVGDDSQYPANIQAAEAKVAAQRDAQAAATAMGGVPAGTSAAGAPMGAHGATLQPAYPTQPTDGSTNRCVGPQSFCNLFSGG